MESSDGEGRTRGEILLNGIISPQVESWDWSKEKKKRARGGRCRKKKVSASSVCWKKAIILMRGKPAFSELENQISATRGGGSTAGHFLPRKRERALLGGLSSGRASFWRGGGRPRTETGRKFTASAQKGQVLSQRQRTGKT